MIKERSGRLVNRFRQFYQHYIRRISREQLLTFLQLMLVSLALLVGVLILSNQSGVRDMMRSNRILVENTQELQNEMVDYVKQTNQRLKDVTEQMKVTNSTLKQTSKDLAAKQKTLSKEVGQLGQKLKGKSADIQDKLKKEADQLGKVIDQLDQDHSQIRKTVSLYNSITGKHDYQKTDKYHIYGVENYGVVLKDSNGNYTIAQINKRLSIGVITAITADYVIAGDYRITADTGTDSQK